MNRRTDNVLRDAISVIERMVLTKPPINTVLMRCLSQLMILFGSRFGYVYHCQDSSEDFVPWELMGSYSFTDGSLTETPNVCNTDRVPEMFADKLRVGKCITFEENDDTPPLPRHHPEIKNTFCVPLCDANNIYGVIFLCNLPQEMKPETEKRLRPFLAAASCLLRSVKIKAPENNTVPTDENSIQAPEHLIDPPNSFLNILDSMFNAVLIIDDTDRIKLCNVSAAKMLKVPRDKIVGAPVSSFLPKGVPQFGSQFKSSETYKNEILKKVPKTQDLRDVLNDQSPNKKPIWRGVAALAANGEKVLIDLSAFDFPYGKTILRGLVLDDISERMRSASNYHATLQRFQAITSLAPVGILQLDKDWRCTYANDKWCEYCQITPEEAQGISWLKGIHPQDADHVLNELRKETAVSGKYEGEFRLQSPLGKILWVKANASSLYFENGEISGMIITFNDITQHRKNEARLRDIAETDQLTGLVNRNVFNDRLDIALKGVSRFGSVAVMFIDLDEFKQVNDTLGHEAGDTLLCEVACRFRETLRQVDTIARIGGDEFTIILTNVNNTRSIQAIAHKLLLVLAKPIDIDGRPIYISCSIGIAVAERNNEDSKQIIKQADAALYKAKDAGRNQYHFYTPGLNSDSNQHILLRQSLKAKERSDFRVVYQPIVDATTGKIVSLEALSRWCRDDIDTVDPDVFIKMIEESGLIKDFSEWLFQDVFSTLNRWNKIRKLKPRVSINVSAKQLKDKDLANFIGLRCRSQGVAPSSITLEVTETALIDEPQIANVTLKKLSMMGFNIALDDFGTGFSSLSHLRNMPLNIVKIDRSFVKDILHDEEDAKIVEGILSLTKTLNLNVVAEGVDNSDVKDWLLEHDCPMQQGFYFHKPLEKDAIEKLLELESTSNLVNFGKNIS